METEIDLKPYVRTLLRRWWVIVTAGVVLAVIAGGLEFSRAPYQSTASILLLTARDSSLSITNAATVNPQREALLKLIVDRALEKRVAEVLKNGSNSLLSQITVNADGDLLKVTARAATGYEAEQLVTAWVQEYAKLVAETYTRNISSREFIEQQLVEAQQRYRLAQAELERFIAEGEIIQLEREVKRLDNLIISAQSAAMSRFGEYLSRSNTLEQLLRDARLLRNRLEQQPLNDVNQADSIAAFILRIRNLSDRGADRPMLQLDSSLTDRASVTIAELDQLISALEAEQRAVRSEIQRLSELQNENGDLSPDAIMSLYRKLAAAQTRLEQLYVKRNELIRDRDIAANSVNSLLQQLEDLRIAKSAPQASIRHLSTTTVQASLISRRIAVQAMAAALASMVLMSVIIVILEAIAIARRNTTPQPKPTGD